MKNGITSQFDFGNSLKYIMVPIVIICSVDVWGFGTCRVNVLTSFVDIAVDY